MMDIRAMFSSLLVRASHNLRADVLWPSCKILYRVKDGMAQHFGELLGHRGISPTIFLFRCGGNVVY